MPFRILLVALLAAGCGSSAAPRGDGGTDAGTDHPPDIGDVADVALDLATDAASIDDTDNSDAADAEPSSDAPISADGIDAAPLDADVADDRADVADDPADVADDPADVADDSGGVSVDTGSARGARIYVALATLMSGTHLVTDLVAIDVAAGRAIADTVLIGTTAIATRNGTLLAARGGGYTRISVLDPTTLAVLRTQLLPWDPEAAVFSADGRYLYAAHDDGWVAQVRVDDGVVTSSVRPGLPNGASGSAALGGLALDRTGTRLAATGVNGGLGSFVAVMTIAGETIASTDLWWSTPFPSSNCARFAVATAFNRASTKLATFDNNCIAVDVYDLATRAMDPAASVLFDRSFGSTSYANIVADAQGHFWATNTDHLYRTGDSPAAAKAIPFTPEAGPLVTDTKGENVYAFQHDPRVNGVHTVELATGALTRLPWNLDLVRQGAAVALAVYDGP